MLHRGACQVKDIARDLNVPVVTVSKVLRNDGAIGPATRERVLRRMKALATRRTYIIGLVAPDLMKGYHVLISNAEEDAQLESREVEHLVRMAECRPTMSGWMTSRCGFSPPST